MIRLPPRSTRTDTLLPYTTLFRSPIAAAPYTAEHIIKQVAALPYRIEPDGAARILLITSRETRRWIIPKGNPIRGLEAHQAAAREAFEEAGISGIACPSAIGQRSEERRVGQEWVRTCRSGGSPDNLK